MHNWKGRCLICNTIFALLIIGALNWGLTGLGELMGRNLNLVNLILGGVPTVEAIVYLLVGAAALAKLFYHCKCGGSCCDDCGDCDACGCGHDHGHEHSHDHEHHDHGPEAM
ncbi:MAG TPA: DUF378 domain-containing protein [Candidatus Peribacteraceae bacterium]|nr:DUF378 domain-containing protein [Candidatus Peribacteraceae bacterium]